MTTQDASNPSLPAENPDEAHEPLPEVPTSLTAEEITRRLDAAARRGRLPGYSTGGPGRGTLFEVRDFGGPIEGVLRARLQNGVLRFDVAMQPRLLIVLAVILALSVWPGVWLTESLIASLFPTSGIWKWTAWWYLPLSIGTAPWALWTVMTRSRRSIDAGARELIGKIAAELAPPAPTAPAAQPPASQPTPR